MSDNPFECLDNAPTDAALEPATRTMQAVMASEEARFSNLNTTAVNLLTATSLIAALVGLFSQDLLGDKFDEDLSELIPWTLIAALVGLLGTVILLVGGVLIPSRHKVFESNAIMDQPSSLSEEQVVHATAFKQFRSITTSLRKRNKRKAAFLHIAYGSFFVTVVAIGVAAVGAVMALG